MTNKGYDPLKAEERRLRVFYWLFVHVREKPVITSISEIARCCGVPSHSVTMIFRHKDAVSLYNFEKIARYTWKITAKTAKNC